MKNVFAAIAFALCLASSVSAQSFWSEAGEEYTVINYYKVLMRLDIPQVFDNTQSLGYRKYKRHSIKGMMCLKFKKDEITPDVEFLWLTNSTHKINGKKVTYEVERDMERSFDYVLLGDNKTEVFKTSAMAFSIICNPSYAIWEKPTEDNALYLDIAVRGNTKSTKYGRVFGSLSGNVSGRMGCGCSDYGHKSPTRIAWAFDHTGIVIDKAPVKGNITFRYAGSDVSTKGLCIPIH